MATIKIKRGTEGDIPTLAAGEPGFTTDTYKLFVGDGATNRQIASGDVSGPAGAVADRIATFNSTTGKLIKDGGQTIAEVIAAASGGVDLLKVWNFA